MTHTEGVNTIVFKSVESKVNKHIDYAGLCLIGLVSLGFLLYYRAFAKLNIYLSFIKAPFFIGDMVFVSCFFLFFLKWLINPKKVSNMTLIFLGYFTFVTIKTILGYYFCGPLALRHAVMFYYPFFAVLIYSFYRPDFFSIWRRLVLISVFLFIFSFLYFHPHYNLTCFLLIVILINSCKNKAGKLILFVFLAFLFPYRAFFDTSRSFITGNVLAFTYILSLVLAIAKVKRIYKIIIFAFFTLFIVFGLLTMSSRNDLKSLVGFDALSYNFHLLEDSIRVNEKNFVEPKLGVRLYNEKRDTFAEIEITKRAILEAAKKEPSFATNFKVRSYSEGRYVSKQIKIIQDAIFKAVKKLVVAQAPKTEHEVLFDSKINRPVSGDIGAEQRTINVSYANILFRVFIWRDAFNELIQEKPILGFDFGKPFLSHALGVLGWATTEWMVDGWICLHNSYIDLVYRSGAVGILMIATIIILLFIFTIVSVRKRSLAGILLTGILINWFIAANFIEILEMPYSAIPLWSLCGLTFAYLFKNKTI